MEVAIKMALRLWDVRMKKRDLEGTPGRSAESYGSDDIGGYMGNIVVLTQRDCHHGEQKRRQSETSEDRGKLKNIE